jgi:hypothetical protein
VKEELNNIWKPSKKETETLETKSYLCQIKNTVPSNSRRQERVEDTISGLEGKVDFFKGI